MPYLHILVFPVGPMVPNSLAHWALYLPPEDGGPGPGRMFTVQKQALFSNTTAYSTGTYTLQPGVLAVPLNHICISHSQMDYICQTLSNDPNRPGFNLVTQNCHDWVVDVVRKVEEYLRLPQRTNVRYLLSLYGY